MKDNEAIKKSKNIIKRMFELCTTLYVCVCAYVCVGYVRIDVCSHVCIWIEFLIFCLEHPAK